MQLLREENMENTLTILKNESGFEKIESEFVEIFEEFFLIVLLRSINVQHQI